MKKEQYSSDMHLSQWDRFIFQEYIGPLITLVRNNKFLRISLFTFTIFQDEAAIVAEASKAGRVWSSTPPSVNTWWQCVIYSITLWLLLPLHAAEELQCNHRDTRDWRELIAKGDLARHPCHRDGRRLALNWQFMMTAMSKDKCPFWTNRAIHLFKL